MRSFEILFLLNWTVFIVTNEIHVSGEDTLKIDQIQLLYCEDIHFHSYLFYSSHASVILVMSSGVFYYILTSWIEKGQCLCNYWNKYKVSKIYSLDLHFSHFCDKWPLKKKLGALSFFYISQWIWEKIRNYSCLGRC